LATFPTKLLELRFEIPEPFEAIKRPFTVKVVEEVPTLVMFGWRGWETTRATFALATFPTKLLELRFEIPEPFEAIKRPLTVKVVEEVPTLVMFGWRGWETTRATFALATFPTKLLELRFEIPEPFEAIKRPLTVKVVDEVPTLVILGCRGWETTRATFALATFPTKLLELMFEIPEPFEAIKRPFTVKVVEEVPTLVILGCKGCETTRETLAFATFPTKLLEFRFEIAEPFEAIKSPLTVKVVEEVPTLVILGCEAWETTRATLAFATFPTKLLEFRFEIAEPFEAIKSPLTVKVVEEVPTLVMLGWSATVTLWAVGAIP
jgi:hypothetical protein